MITTNYNNTYCHVRPLVCILRSLMAFVSTRSILVRLTLVRLSKRMVLETQALTTRKRYFSVVKLMEKRIVPRIHSLSQLSDCDIVACFIRKTERRGEKHWWLIFPSDEKYKMAIFHLKQVTGMSTRHPQINCGPVVCSIRPGHQRRLYAGLCYFLQTL